MLLGAWLVQLVKHPTSAHSSRVQAPSLKINKLQKYYFIKSRASNSYHFRQIYGEEQHDSKLIQSLCICQGEKCCWRTQTWFWIVAFFFWKGKYGIIMTRQRPESMADLVVLINLVYFAYFCSWIFLPTAAVAEQLFCTVSIHISIIKVKFCSWMKRVDHMDGVHVLCGSYFVWICQKL